MEGCGTGEAHDDPPLLAACRPLGLHDGAVDLAQYPAGVGKERSARVGQFNAAWFSAEELYVEFPLEAADLLTEGRLLYPEAFRRPGHMAFLGHGDEVAEMSQLHDISFRYGLSLYYILEIISRHAHFLCVLASANMQRESDHGRSGMPR